MQCRQITPSIMIGPPSVARNNLQSPWSTVADRQLERDKFTDGMPTPFVLSNLAGGLCGIPHGCPWLFLANLVATVWCSEAACHVPCLTYLDDWLEFQRTIGGIKRCGPSPPSFFDDQRCLQKSRRFAFGGVGRRNFVTSPRVCCAVQSHACYFDSELPPLSCRRPTVFGTSSAVFRS